MKFEHSISAIFLGALLAAVPAVASINLISNGDFLGAPDPFLTLYAGSTTINNWTVTHGSVDWIGNYWAAPKSDGSMGGRSVDLDGFKSPGAISQTVNTIANNSYTLSFYISANSDGPPPIKNLLVSEVGTDNILSFVQYTPSNPAKSGVWEHETFVFTASTNLTTISFESQDTSDEAPGDNGVSFGPVVAGVSLTPEPGFYGVLGLGLAGFAFFVRRRVA